MSTDQQINLGTQPAVSVNYGDSSRDIGFGGDIHHLALVIDLDKTKQYSGAVLQLPTFSTDISYFPKVELEKLEFDFAPSKTGSTIVVAMTGEGASVSRDTAWGYKQSSLLSCNAMTVNTTLRATLTPGDGVASQIKPVSSTAIAPYFHFFAHPGCEGRAVLHVYYRISGPMNKVAVFQ